MKKKVLIIAGAVLAIGIIGGGVWYWQRGTTSKQVSEKNEQKAVMESAENDITQGWLNFFDPALKISMKYPKEWQVDVPGCGNKRIEDCLRQYYQPFKILKKNDIHFSNAYIYLYYDNDMTKPIKPSQNNKKDFIDEYYKEKIKYNPSDWKVVKRGDDYIALQVVDTYYFLKFAGLEVGYIEARVSYGENETSEDPDIFDKVLAIINSIKEDDQEVGRSTDLPDNANPQKVLPADMQKLVPASAYINKFFDIDFKGDGVPERVVAYTLFDAVNLYEGKTGDKYYVKVYEYSGSSWNVLKDDEGTESVINILFDKVQKLTWPSVDNQEYLQISKHYGGNSSSWSSYLFFYDNEKRLYREFYPDLIGNEAIGPLISLARSKEAQITGFNMMLAGIGFEKNDEGFTFGNYVFNSRFKYNGNGQFSLLNKSMRDIYDSNGNKIQLSY